MELVVIPEILPETDADRLTVVLACIEARVSYWHDLADKCPSPEHENRAAAEEWFYRWCRYIAGRDS